ncbi:MAG TPA: toll/interleukin-1 receptor domain-containing protein [Pseudonocardiaceae bacterium]
MPRVFINYRSGDEENCAVLVERELRRVLGKDNVFRASSSIPVGRTFDKALLRAVRRSDVLIAVIGERWLDATDARGSRKLDDPKDWTRREIKEAFDCGILVVPLLINRTAPLVGTALPGKLARLARLQYLRFHHRNADADLRQLVERLVELDGSSPSEPAKAPAEVPKATTTVGGVGSITGRTVTAVTGVQGNVQLGRGTQINQNRVRDSRIDSRGTGPGRDRR